jgi:galactokinase
LHIDLNDEFEINLADSVKLTDNVWTNYIEGYQSIENKGFDFEGFNCVFSSNIPVGSGLSSSAALGVAFYLD